jgi:hypothetical protein
MCETKGLGGSDLLDGLRRNLVLNKKRRSLQAGNEKFLLKFLFKQREHTVDAHWLKIWWVRLPTI